MRLSKTQRDNLKSVLAIQSGLRPVYPNENFTEMLSSAAPYMQWQTLAGNSVPSGGITKEVYRDNIIEDPELVQISRHHSKLSKLGNLVHLSPPDQQPNLINPENTPELTKLLADSYQQIAAALKTISQIQAQTPPHSPPAEQPQNPNHLEEQPKTNPSPELSTDLHANTRPRPKQKNYELSEDDAAEFTELLRAQALIQKIPIKQRYYTLLDKFLPLLNTEKFESRTIPTGGVIEAVYSANKHLHPRWAEAANQHLNHYRNNEQAHIKRRTLLKERRQPAVSKKTSLKPEQLPPEEVKQLIRLLLAQTKVKPIQNVDEYRTLFRNTVHLLNTKTTDKGIVATGGIRPEIMDANAAFYPELVVAHETHIRVAQERERQHIANQNAETSQTQPHQQEADDNQLAKAIIRLSLHLAGVATQAKDQYQTDFQNCNQFFDWQTGRLKNTSKNGEPTPYQRFKQHEGVLAAISHHEKHVRIKTAAHSLTRYTEHITGKKTHPDEVHQADIAKIKTHIDLQTGAFKNPKHPNSVTLSSQLHRFPEAEKAYSTLLNHLQPQQTNKAPELSM